MRFPIVAVTIFCLLMPFFASAETYSLAIHFGALKKGLDSGKISYAVGWENVNIIDGAIAVGARIRKIEYQAGTGVSSGKCLAKLTFSIGGKDFLTGSPIFLGDLNKIGLGDSCKSSEIVE